MAAAEPSPPSSRLPLRTKVIYGLGDWGTSASTTARNAFWFFFLTSVVGLDPALGGLIFLVGRLWDGINDPLVGAISDRLDTRWGRRRPLLLFGAVPFGFAFILLFFVPPFATSTFGLTVYYILAFLLFDTLYTVINVPYSALTPALTADYDERSNLTGWRIGISIIAALVTGGLFKLLAEQLFAGWFGGGATGIRLGYLLSAVIWGVTMIIPYFVLVRAIEEPDHEPERDPIRPWRTFREVFNNRPFRFAATLYLLTFATVDVVLIVWVRFLIDYIRVTPGFDNLLLAAVLGVAVLTMPLSVFLMRRFGKRRAYIGSMIMLSLALFIISQVPPGGQNLVLLAAFVAGPGFGAAQAVPWAIVADVIESDELQTGKRREGVFYGYLAFFRKLASALAIFAVGQLLSLAGFITTTQGSVFIDQPQSAVLAMRFIVGILPGIMLSLAMIAAWRYPLDRETFNDIRRQLALRQETDA
ncbi:MAG: glycoside-pentoside-hexuronide (GPH):cation symporter [Candidatus Promineifilaceae bacterium]|nr:glycoside-pentoside-hexuronide (GPH):cation symporter [Candidatus Promineifilaceae bacterium]